MNTKHFTISRLVLALIVAAALTGTLLAQSQNSAPKMPNKNYMLTIDGTATMVGKWACGGDANVDAKPAASAQPVPGLPEGVQTVMVTASVPGIECGDSTMNKHLRKALKMDEYPEIRYQAEKYTLVDNGSAVQTSGELTIAGVTKPVGLGAKLIPLPEGGTRVVGTVEINMADFGVKPPSLFFGALKVANVVSVKFDTVVRLPHEVTEALFPKQ
jgi:polyisoprenoid-binding protein YceI